MEDRRILERQEHALRGQVELIAEEFLQGFEAVDRIGGPGVTVFGSARVSRDSPASRCMRMA